MLFAIGGVAVKMAVASKKEIDSALVLAGIIDDLDSGTYPRWVNGEYLDSDPDHFDADDEEHLRELYKRLMKVELPWRVVLGYAVLTDPRNRIIDPDLSYLELHPRLREGLVAAEQPIAFWFKRIWKGAVEILREGWNL